jgi:hypothetical protein
MRKKFFISVIKGGKDTSRDGIFKKCSDRLLLFHKNRKHILGTTEAKMHLNDAGIQMKNIT